MRTRPGMPRSPARLAAGLAHRDCCCCSNRGCGVAVVDLPSWVGCAVSQATPSPYAPLLRTPLPEVVELDPESSWLQWDLAVRLLDRANERADLQNQRE